MPDGSNFPTEALAPQTVSTLDPFMRIREVEAETRLSRSAIYRRMAAGTFPRPQQLAGGTVRWRQSKVRAWMEEQPDAGRATPPGTATGVAPAPEPRPRRRPGRPRKA
jgi:prophage regulatory protein